MTGNICLLCTCRHYSVADPVSGKLCKLLPQLNLFCRYIRNLSGIKTSEFVLLEQYTDTVKDRLTKEDLDEEILTQTWYALLIHTDSNTMQANA